MFFASIVSVAPEVKGNNLSTGAKISIGVGIAVGALIILGLIGIRYWSVLMTKTAASFNELKPQNPLKGT